MGQMVEKGALVALTKEQLLAIEELIEGELEIRTKASTNKGAKLSREVLVAALNVIQLGLYGEIQY